LRLKYIGNGAFLTGVPARDLSAIEVGFYGEERLKNSGIYAEHIRKPKAEKPADSNIQEAKDGWN
jgi:hypothetical protein